MASAQNLIMQWWFSSPHPFIVGFSEIHTHASGSQLLVTSVCLCWPLKILIDSESTSYSKWKLNSSSRWIFKFDASVQKRADSLHLTKWKGERGERGGEKARDRMRPHLRQRWGKRVHAHVRVSVSVCVCERVCASVRAALRSPWEA